ncbi:MAG: UDP-N-acetylenolpyruvoylglucosamine reductase [Candidatus Nomurabacteria bacterium GW2011_GWA1_46_11]|uniref:UDP-N-acetylenolpyruvoylglucosamine reductase n=1 Tax=Candidatus Nomurabacteria bacterium GW2011_GWA1_46_11 TaxID=1618732 RepID=A0A0G1NNK5_9BACT|nr:MAG: UDP-N-acetylenolpyruvoylglucosamine reductase [Candidatus Nomurabacteria bacterium GW2011_GWA1_46_11]
MKIKKNYNLSKLNTFGIQANAKFFAEVNTEAELEELFRSPEFKSNEKVFLGGGSNLLLTRDWPGIAVLNKRLAWDCRFKQTKRDRGSKRKRRERGAPCHGRGDMA